MKSRPTTAQVLLTDADRVTIARLSAKCAGMRTSTVIAAVYADPTVQQVLFSREPSDRDRIAYLSGAVVAEVALARLAKRVA